MRIFRISSSDGTGEVDCAAAGTQSAQRAPNVSTWATKVFIVVLLQKHQKLGCCVSSRDAQRQSTFPGIPVAGDSSRLIGLVQRIQFLLDNACCVQCPRSDERPPSGDDRKPD